MKELIHDMDLIIENLSHNINEYTTTFMQVCTYIITMNNIRKYGGAWVGVFRYIHNCQSF